MVITIISKCGEYPQAWTFDIKEKDLIELMEKYDGCGEGVLLDAAELPRDIEHYHK